MSAAVTGVGLAWRPATALAVAERAARGQLAFTEVIAEAIDPKRPPRALMALVERGVAVIPHGVELSLGGAEPLDDDRLAHLAAVARVLRAPLVSEHVAFTRAGGAAAGHLLPVPRTRAAMIALVDHVRRAQAALPVPLALENIAAPLAWPDDATDEAGFLAELCARTGAGLLLDVANLLGNCRNHGGDPVAALDRFPLAHLAYVHVAGGAWAGRFWRDTHGHPVTDAALALVTAIAARVPGAPILLERDHAIPDRAALGAELDAIAAARATPAIARAAIVTPHLPATSPGEHGDRRRALARDQRALIAALATDAPPPRGLDAAQLSEARAIVRSKRERVHGHAGCHIVRA